MVRKQLRNPRRIGAGSDNGHGRGVYPALCRQSAPLRARRATWKVPRPARPTQGKDLHLMDRGRPSRAVGLLMAAGITFLGAACASDDTTGGGGSTPNGPVTITVNGLPPATEAAQRKNFLADVAEFEAANPNIKIDAKEGFMVPQQFQAKLAGGQLEDVFYVYFTDPAALIAKRQVADV